MKKKKEDWPHEILKHLFKNYSVFDVYINDFLKEKFKVDQADGNLGRKVVRILNELKEKKLITWNHTDHSNEEIELSTDNDDNTSVTLEKYRFHTRLTLEGLDYIGNFVRIQKQQYFTISSLVSSGLATIFIIITTVKSCTDKTANEIRGLNDRLLESVQQLDSIRKTQQELNYTIEDMIKANQPQNKQEEKTKSKN